MTKSTGSPRLASEVTVFLRNMYSLNMSIVQQLSPILDQRHGIDLRLYFILHGIDQGHVYPGAIAQAMGLPNSLITKHLDQLAQKGMVERGIDPEDSRRVRVSLTEKGMEVMQGADNILAEQVGDRLTKIPAERRADFLATLVDLVRDEGK